MFAVPVTRPLSAVIHAANGGFNTTCSSCMSTIQIVLLEGWDVGIFVLLSIRGGGRRGECCFPETFLHPCWSFLSVDELRSFTMPALPATAASKSLLQ